MSERAVNNGGRAQQELLELLIANDHGHFSGLLCIVSSLITSISVLLSNER